jgi:hypothetical protein
MLLMRVAIGNDADGFVKNELLYAIIPSLSWKEAVEAEDRWKLRKFHKLQRRHN